METPEIQESGLCTPCDSPDFYIGSSSAVASSSRKDKQSEQGEQRSQKRCNIGESGGGKHLPGGNRDMVRLLRMCVDYGEDRVIFAKNQIPGSITPTVDLIRSYLEEPEKNTVIRFQNDVNTNQINLA